MVELALLNYGIVKVDHLCDSIKILNLHISSHYLEVTKII